MTPRVPGWEGWAPLAVLPVAVAVLAPPEWPKWLFMWVLAFALFVGCKWLTWRRTPVAGATHLRHIGYLFAWPGLDAAAFLNPERRPMRPTRAEWLFALGKSALGVAILFGVVRFVPDESPYLVGWVGMIGLIFALHFGTFHLLSCFWRSVGVEAKPLMHWPLTARSIGDFWGQRWNTAFRDLTHRFLFRPLIARIGARPAIAAGFLFSGLIHEVVISLPADGGYGGPTLFFAIQGCAMLAEKSTVGRRLGSGRGPRGWLFALFVLVAPVGLLFHPPFVSEIVVPFLRAMGAI